MSPVSYRDPNLPVEDRVTDLIAHMTLTEKCAQLIGPFGLDEGDGQLPLDFLRQHFKDGISYVGTHHRKRKTRQTVMFMNGIQKFLREETRLGIPALGVGEGLHGYMAHEATSFPQAIGLASAWDPELHKRMKHTVKIPIWSRDWVWLPSAVCREVNSRATRSTCWQLPNILQRMVNPKQGQIAVLPIMPNESCGKNYLRLLKRLCVKARSGPSWPPIMRLMGSLPM